MCVVYTWELSKGRYYRVRLLVWTLLIALIFLTALGASRVWPYVSFYVFSNSFLRMEVQAAQLEKRLLSANEAPSILLSSLNEARRLAELTQNAHPLDPLAYYYQALFDFYELALRLPLEQNSLLALTGRSLLPEQMSLPELKSISTLELSERLSLGMRKALALGSGFLRNKQAHIILAYANILFTGRTDLGELEHLEKYGKDDDLSPLLMKYRDWTLLTYYAHFGKNKLLFYLVRELMLDSSHNENTEKNIIPTDFTYGDTPNLKSKDSHRFHLDRPSAYLILSHGFYKKKDYIKALRYARKVKALPNLSDHLQSEAVRMEAEIFYVQRSPVAAHPYFKRAYAISDSKDEFIKSRLDELYVR